MPKVAYIDKSPSPERLAIIDQANAIIVEYQAQGFTLTLRQLYYQFVARGLVPNRDAEYKRLGDIVNDGRLCGLIDWRAIIDRTRNVITMPPSSNPKDTMRWVAEGFLLDHWAGQPVMPEVWIEKDALVGVIQGVCRELRVPYFSCRGYTSQSEMWEAGQRLRRYAQGGQIPLIIHLGDHDPSGIDMSRDIRDRLSLFAGVPIQVDRIALTMDQVRQFNPPPNPAKLTDSRVGPYIEAYGNESWELDALEPATLAALIRESVEGIRDLNRYERVLANQAVERRRLTRVADRWDELVDAVTDDDDSDDYSEEDDS